jgi:predicted membrane metal-binding protein
MQPKARRNDGRFEAVKVVKMAGVQGNTEVTMGSDRSFGLVFAVVFLIVALLPLWGGGDIRIWALIVAVIFVVVSFTVPKVLRPLNRVWFLFGLLLHKVVSPIVMGFLFFITVTPIGLIMRALGKDPLHQAMDKDADTYWIAVDREKAAQSSMRNQY